MTEQQWLSSIDPAAMLAFYTSPMGQQLYDGPKPSDRKLRLFACACCDHYGVDTDGYSYGEQSGTDTLEWVQNWCNIDVRPAGGIYSYKSRKVEPDVRPDILRHLFTPFRGPLSRTCGECKADLELLVKKQLSVSEVIDVLRCKKCKGKGWLPVEPPTRECERCKIGVGVDEAWEYCIMCHGTGRLPAWPAVIVQLAGALYAGEDVAFALHDVLREHGYDSLADHFAGEAWHPQGCAHLDVLLCKE